MSKTGIVIVLIAAALTYAAYRLRDAFGQPLYGLLIPVLAISMLVGWLDWAAKKPATSKWKKAIPILSVVPTVEQIPLLHRLIILAALLAVGFIYYLAVR